MQCRKQQLILHHLPPLQKRILLRWNFLQWQRNMRARLISRTMILQRVCTMHLSSLPLIGRIRQCVMNSGRNSVRLPQKVKLVSCVRVWQAFVKRQADRAQLWGAACAQCGRTQLRTAWKGWRLACELREAQMQQSSEAHSRAWRRFQAKLLQAWTCLCKVKVSADAIRSQPVLWLEKAGIPINTVSHAVGKLGRRWQMCVSQQPEVHCHSGAVCVAAWQLKCFAV